MYSTAGIRRDPRKLFGQSPALWPFSVRIWPSRVMSSNAAAASASSRKRICVRSSWKSTGVIGHARLFEVGQRLVVQGLVGALEAVEGGLQDADFHGVQRAVRLPVEGVGGDGAVEAVGPVNGVQHQGAVLDTAADGADLVHGPTQGHGAVPADAAVGGTQSDRAALRARRNDGAERLGAERETDQPRRGGRRGTGGRSARPLLRFHGFLVRP